MLSNALILRDVRSESVSNPLILRDVRSNSVSNPLILNLTLFQIILYLSDLYLTLSHLISHTGLQVVTWG